MTKIQSDWFSLINNCRIEDNRVKLPNGTVTYRLALNVRLKNPRHPATNALGLDLDITKLITTSNGATIKPKNSLKANQVKLARLQRQLVKKLKCSENWKKQNGKIQKLHHHIANVRHDYLHKITTTLSKSHTMIVVEDLKVSNMSESASGSMENKGCNVKPKSGLTKSILDQGWGMALDMFEYKQHWRGGLLIKVNPRFTS